MYIGDTCSRGLHHLVSEVVDNSIDEAMAKFASHISVTVNADGSVTVEDDGRGIPVDRHDQLSEEIGRDISTLEGVMTVLKFGGKRSAERPGRKECVSRWSPSLSKRLETPIVAVSLQATTS